MFLIIFKFTSAQGAATDIGKKKETGEYSGFPNRQSSVSPVAFCRRSWLTSRMKQCRRGKRSGRLKICWERKSLRPQHNESRVLICSTRDFSYTLFLSRPSGLGGWQLFEPIVKEGIVQRNNISEPILYREQVRIILVWYGCS